MIADADVWRAANLLIKQHGDDAPIHAAMRADELLAEGDLEGVAIWKAIIRAIDELLTKERPQGTSIH